MAISTTIAYIVVLFQLSFCLIKMALYIRMEIDWFQMSLYYLTIEIGPAA
jgi:hypothetical protein